MAELFKEIKPADYAQKGIRVKNNPLGLPVAEAQRAFDELSLDVIIPSFNTLADKLNSLKLDERVSSGDIRGIRVNSDNAIEITTDGVTWVAAGSSGHVIIDGSGKQYAQRSRLQFKNVNILDNGTATVIEGIQGIQGAKGAKGDKGDKGEKGDKGDLGKAWLPNISSNGDLNWTQSDTTMTPSTVNIRGPQGVQGVQGLQGAIGPQGQQGTQGPRGVQGVQGEKGDRGEVGAQGPAGAQGIQGPKGEKGDRGSDGADGKSLKIQDVYKTYVELVTALPEGDEYTYQVTDRNNELFIWSEGANAWVSVGELKGAKGEKGDAGSIEIGKVTTGEAGTQAVVANVGTLSEAVLNFTIPKGDIGPQGPQGIQGIQGLQGEVGPQGPQGIQGVPGAQGQSAFQAAVSGGYTGTETSFNSALAVVPSQAQQNVWSNKVGSVNGKTGTSITLTAADIKINGPNNKKYRWGIDVTGVYLEEV